LKPLLAGAVPFLITAANVLNELPPERRGRFEGYGDGPGDRTGMDGMDGEDGSLAVSQLAGMASEGSLSNLLSSLLPLLRARRGQTPPRLLFIEPGTRLGGSTLMELRALALDEGLLPLAPCPHGLACPLRRDDAEEAGWTAPAWPPAWQVAPGATSPSMPRALPHGWPSSRWRPASTRTACP
ncbi:MAG: hypothetical protein II515_07910, partial [Desulfovibrio sp.]|nr:hypothetical protein [Desulfovibrio sp.]